jgi:hypothetical protein
VTHATPQLTTLQRVGGSMGTAILTVILQTHLESAGASQAAQADAFGTTFLWVMGITAAALLPTLLLARIERRAGHTTPDVAPPSPIAEAETRELALESA